MNESKIGYNPLSWGAVGWQRLLWVAAAWNILGGLPWLLLPKTGMWLFYGIASDDVHMRFFHGAFWAAVMIFGLGYALVAARPRANHGILVLGIVAKVAVTWAWVAMYRGHHATIFAPLAGLGDLLFAALFLMFLLVGRNAMESAPDGPPSTT